ncbi:MAG TPA: hypothetical protein VNG93_13990 [Candidatus Dormibacteraeota bacterium]|nr:hypothetical protein [Candidatus Dormibacteraeota bacterium]
MELSPRPHLTPVWTLFSTASTPVVVDRSSRWSQIGNLPALAAASPASTYPVQLARSLGIQILAARAA